MVISLSRNFLVVLMEIISVSDPLENVIIHSVI